MTVFVRFSLLSAVVISLMGCSALKSSYIRPDYDTTDKTKTVRLAIFVASLPEGKESIAQLWGEMAQKYINDKRDFIVKSVTVSGSIENVCVAGIEGVLTLVPTLKKDGNGIEEDVKAEIRRCPALTEVVWNAQAAGSFSSVDDKLTAITDSYVGKYGDDVKPFVAPAFNLLRPLLDSLPLPQLDAAGIDEKIELD